MRPNPQFPDDLVIFAEEILSPISTGGKEEGGGGYHRGIILSRTLERQMILN